MPGRIDPADRKILITVGAALLVISLVAAFFSPVEEDRVVWPSSYSPARGGAKAAFLLLQNLGFRVERWTQPPTQLSEVPQPAVLILAEPTVFGSNDDRMAIDSFLREGGTVLAIGRADLLVTGVRIRPGMPHFEWRSYYSRLPSALTRNADEISMAPAVFWWNRHAGEIVHYSDGEEQTVVSYPAGRGEVIWWAAATPLTNNGIQEKQNLQLFLNSIGSTDRRVLWDEYFHEGGRTVWNSVFESPLKWALAQLGIVALLILFTFTRRHGPIFALPQPSRLSPLEFVETLGGLYKRARATQISVEVAYQRFRYLACKRLGLPSSARGEDIAATLAERLPLRDRDLPSLIANCESKMHDPDLKQAEALTLVRALHGYCARLNSIGNSKGEKN